MANRLIVQRVMYVTLLKGGMKKEKEREISAIFKRFHVATLTKKSKYIALHMRGEWPKDSWTRLFPPPKKVGFLILLPSFTQNLVTLSSLYIHAFLPLNNPFNALPPPPSHNHLLLSPTQMLPCRSSSPLLFRDGSMNTDLPASSR